MRKLAYARQTVSGELTRRSCSLCVSYHNFFPASARPSKHKCLPLPTYCFPFQNFGVPHLSSRVGLLRWLKGSRIRGGMVLINWLPTWPRRRFQAPLLHSQSGAQEIRKTLPTVWFPASGSNHSEALRQGGRPTEPLCTLPPLTKHAKISTGNLDVSTDTVTHVGFC